LTCAGKFPGVEENTGVTAARASIRMEVGCIFIEYAISDIKEYVGSDHTKENTRGAMPAF
jgi:hypothetical protein